MTDYHEIICDERDSVVRIILNRPEKLNSISHTMRDELVEAWQRFQADDTKRVLILTGAGKGFCSGEDVRILAQNVERQAAQAAPALAIRPAPRPQGSSPLGREFVQIVRKPVIAALNGVAAGAGIGLALAADIRIASSQARFAHIYSRRGRVTSSEVWYLPRYLRLGPAVAHLLLADETSPEEALRLGLVVKVVPPEALEGEAWEMASRLAERPLVSTQFTKEAVRFGLTHNLEETMDWVGWARSVSAGSGENREGTTSFLEKRQPRFR